MRKITKWLLFVICLSTVLGAEGQAAYQTVALKENIRSLQIRVNQNPLALPIISLGGSDVLEFFFDEMSYDGHSYGYELTHCNADWSPSQLSSSEYIKGFARGTIDDYETSLNTTFLYTSYRVQLPNEQTKMTASGNYKLRIFDENEPDMTLCTFGFSIVDSRVEVVGKQRTKTDLGFDNGFQQIDFEIVKKGYTIADPTTELNVMVIQNERTDNRVTHLQPTYLTGDRLSYTNNRKLIFEAGNSYRRFDMSDRYTYDQRIDNISFDQQHFHVSLAKNHVQRDDPWLYDQDVDGGFIINFSDNYDGRTEADYYYVHFLLEARHLPTGEIYIGGKWNANRLDDTSRMEYDADSETYTKTLLLKQGAYNYQYWFVPTAKKQVSVGEIEGNHWQTQNQYVVYVYHRPFGGRYDQLIGVKMIE